MKTQLHSRAFSALTNQTFTPHHSARWRVISLHIHLVNSAAVDNRLMAVAVLSGGLYLWQVMGDLYQTAGLDWIYVLTPGTTPRVDPSTTIRELPIPGEWMPPNSDIRISVIDADAADKMQVQLLVEVEE